MNKIKTKHMKLIAALAAVMLLAATAMTIGVCYAATEVTVTWSVEGTVTTTTVTSGTAPTKPANPTKVGYTFAGWGLSAESSAVLESLPVVYADTTFFAKFEAVKYTITWVYYDENGILQTVKTKCDYGQVPETPEIPTSVNGSQFLAWDIEIAAVTADKTYTATYNHTQYIITYTAELSAEETYTKEIYATGVQDVSGYEAPSKPGYTFRGWSTKNNDRDAIIGENFRISADTTLYAIYTINASAWFTALAWYWQALLITAAVIVVGVIVLVIVAKVKG